MNKFLKLVWSVNGVVILIVFLLAGAVLLTELVRSFRTYSPPELIVGEELEKAKEAGLILQGLEYDAPQPILHANLYILPVSLRTYDNPEQISGLRLMKSGSYSDDEVENMINVVFLTGDFEVQRVLLNEKVFIESLRYPGMNNYNDGVDDDSVQHHITYLIAKEDSNKNGSIEASDNIDLYISDLDGTNLNQISRNVDIIDYAFLDRNRILVSYRERTDQEAEHKKDYFAMYSIPGKEWKELSSLHQSLEKVKNIVTK